VDYCAKINLKMNFKQYIGKELDPSQMSPNPEMRQFYKNALVKCIGFFSLNQEKQREVDYISDYEELIMHKRSGRLLDVNPIGEEHVQIVLGPDTGPDFKRKPSRKSNVVIGALITSIARVVIHKNIMKISAIGGTIFKVCCDSLYFTLPKATPFPFEMSECFGDWKHIFSGEIVGLIQLGVNSLSVLYESTRGLQCESKASGLSLSIFLTGRFLNHKLFSEMCDQLLLSNISNKLQSFTLHNVRTIKDSRKNTIRQVCRKQKVFCANILRRRRLELNYDSKPYGFIPKKIKRLV
jgi:hypothetical protein